jgi:ATP-dependent Clp protease ATP-binding subunit ClpC
MKNTNLNAKSLRARKARLNAKIGFVAEPLMVALAALVLIISVFGIRTPAIVRLGYLGLGLSLLTIVLYLWIRRDLGNLPPSTSPKNLDDILESKFLASLGKDSAQMSPRQIWEIAAQQRYGKFICNRLLLPPSSISQTVSAVVADTPKLWQHAEQLMRATKSPELTAGTLVAAVLMTSEPTKTLLMQLKLKPEDVLETYNWIERLDHFFRQPKPYFGGIGRDWATGYTPNLEKYGQNISNGIEIGRGGHFHTLAHNDVLDTIIYNLGQSGTGVALVGETGVGKTSLVYALAERLLQGHDKNLQHYQIVSLNASAIISAGKDNLESQLLTLLGEAVHAGNIIIFLDEAHLFFGEGTGAFNASHVLQPILEKHQLKLIATFTPNEFQGLRAANESIIGHFTNVKINEPSPAVTMSILEDTALTFELHNQSMISYQAIKEAVRLSGQYMQEDAYPGKAISLLDQAAAYAEQGVITANSIGTAIEKTRGIKVGAVQAEEVDQLLNLEQRIHDRMINQSKAVVAVSAALRRTRAGVATTKRPVGSFLFLGPTGVGKTELARSLAATYYGDEKQMIRLDMSEYQQASDVDRLLSDGSGASKSLIMSIREQPFSVVLLDEIEKSHPNILNLLLQMLDEGKITDKNGRPALFTSAIIIATSNAGSVDITQRVASGQNLDSFERPLVDKLIAAGIFRPELINRFDEVALFRPLSQAELGQVAVLMIKDVNKTLSAQSITIQLTEAAMALIIQKGYSPEFGARPMRRIVQKMVEDAVAVRILKNEIKPGQIITLDVNDLGAI